MSGFKLTYCRNCDERTPHDLYISSGDHLHSLCTECGKDAVSRAEFSYENGQGTKNCSNCDTTTEHIRYVSPGNHIHWFCCSCGKDVVSGASI